MPRRRKPDLKVVEFPGGVLGADEVLRDAFREELNEIVVIGTRKESKNLVYLASSPNDDRAIMLIEQAKLMLIVRNRD